MLNFFFFVFLRSFILVCVFLSMSGTTLLIRYLIPWINGRTRISLFARLVMTIMLFPVCYFLHSSTSNSVMYRYKAFSSPRCNLNLNLPPNLSLTHKIHVSPVAQAQAQVPVRAVPFSISPRECPSWDCRGLEARLLGLDFGLVRRAMMSPRLCLGSGAGVA